MKLETILTAMTYAVMERNLLPAHTPPWDKKQRQAGTFRARILRMDKEKDGVIVVMEMGIKHLNEKIAKKDVQISQLMELVRVVDDLRKNHLNSDYLFAMDLAKKLLKEWER